MFLSWVFKRPKTSWTKGKQQSFKGSGGAELWDSQRIFLGRINLTPRSPKKKDCVVCVFGPALLLGWSCA